MVWKSEEKGSITLILNTEIELNCSIDSRIACRLISSYYSRL